MNNAFKNDNIEVMTFDSPDETIDEIFDWLLSRFQVGLETQMRGNNFISDCVILLYYKCHNVNFKRGGSYIASPLRQKRKKQQ